MQLAMACGAESNQVLFGIYSSSAPEGFMMNLELGHSPAALASPSIPLEHLIPKLLI
jgi:hypothetical protein